MKTPTSRTLIATALSSLLLTACGGGTSNPANPEDSDQLPVTQTTADTADQSETQNDTTDAEPTGDGESNSSSSNNGGNNGSNEVATNNTSSGGATIGMPLLYQTGWTLSSYRLETSSGLGITVTSIVDTANNTITDDDSYSIFPDIRYNDQGSIASYGGDISNNDFLGDVVNYNDDGSISSLVGESADGIEYTEFTYENGNFASVTKRLEGGLENRTRSKMIYNQAADGTLINSRIIDLDTGEETNMGYDYTTNPRGLVDSLQLVNVDPSFRKESRFLFTYDQHSNITRIDIFDDAGELLRWTDFTYVQSAEPMPNATAMMMILEPGFYNEYF